MIYLQKAGYIYNKRELVVGLCHKLGSFTGEKQIALLAFQANVKDLFNNCGVCKSKAARDLAYSLSNGTKKVWEANNAKEMSKNVQF